MFTVGADEEFGVQARQNQWGYRGKGKGIARFHRMDIMWVNG